MFSKALILVVGAAAVAAGLVAFRQQRLECANEMARMHHHIDRARRDMWVHQADIAPYLHPRRLQETIDRSPLALESITAAQALADRPFYLVSHSEEARER